MSDGMALEVLSLSPNDIIILRFSKQQHTTEEVRQTLIVWESILPPEVKMIALSNDIPLRKVFSDDFPTFNFMDNVVKKPEGVEE